MTTHVVAIVVHVWLHLSFACIPHAQFQDCEVNIESPQVCAKPSTMWQWTCQCMFGSSDFCQRAHQRTVGSARLLHPWATHKTFSAGMIVSQDCIVNCKHLLNTDRTELIHCDLDIFNSSNLISGGGVSLPAPVLHPLGHAQNVLGRYERQPPAGACVLIYIYIYMYICIHVYVCIYIYIQL